MKCLLAVVLASACVGPMPPQNRPITEYPRGLHALTGTGRCSVAQIERTIDHVFVCDPVYPTAHR